jgi:hypothetical protein
MEFEGALFRHNDRVDCLCKPLGFTSFRAQVRGLICPKSGTAFRAHEYTPNICDVRVAQSLSFSVGFVDQCLSFCRFSFDHGIVFSFDHGIVFSFFDLRLPITPLTNKQK